MDTNTRWKNQVYESNYFIKCVKQILWCHWRPQFTSYVGSTWGSQRIQVFFNFVASKFFKKWRVLRVDNFKLFDNNGKTDILRSLGTLDYLWCELINFLIFGFLVKMKVQSRIVKLRTQKNIKTVLNKSRSMISCNWSTFLYF